MFANLTKEKSITIDDWIAGNGCHTLLRRVLYNSLVATIELLSHTTKFPEHVKLLYKSLNDETPFRNIGHLRLKIQTLYFVA